MTAKVYRAREIAKRERARQQAARLAESASLPESGVRPTLPRLYSLTAKSARQAREREVARIAAEQRIPANTQRPEPTPRFRVSLTSLSQAPRAHARPASDDKARDKRIAELMRARSSPLLRTRDVALSDYVADTTAVRGTTDGRNVRILRELIAAGVRPTADSAIPQHRPAFPANSPTSHVAARVEYDAHTETDSRPSAAQRNAVASLRSEQQIAAQKLAIARTWDSHADRIREAFAMRMFGPPLPAS